MVTLSLLISVCKQVFLRSKEGQQSFILRETNFVLSLMAGAKNTEKEWILRVKA